MQRDAAPIEDNESFRYISSLTVVSMLLSVAFSPSLRSCAGRQRPRSVAGLGEGCGRRITALYLLIWRLPVTLIAPGVGFVPELNFVIYASRQSSPFLDSDFSSCSSS